MSDRNPAATAASVDDLRHECSSCPIQKFWKSDFHLHACKVSAAEFTPELSPSKRDHPLACVSNEEMSARESLADESLLCARNSGSDVREEQLWTNRLTEAVNNVSRECLDRLAKLESENKKLRKQYENLEAQITPLVKSLKAQESYQHWTTPPENGRTMQTPVNCSRQQFDSQLRQLVSVLVHTNIAQNDIREDCRYLKNRVSNLETINAKLFNLVQNQRHSHCGHSCQELTGHMKTDAQTDRPGPMFSAMRCPTSQSPVLQSESCSGHSGTKPETHPEFVEANTSHLSAVTATSPSITYGRLCPSAACDNLASNAVSSVHPEQSPSTPEQSVKAMVLPSACLEGNALHSFSADIKERLLTGCFQSVLEGMLLRASSAPQFPLSSPDFASLSDPFDFGVSKEQSIVRLTCTDQQDYSVAKDCARTAKRRTSIPLPSSEQRTVVNRSVRRNSLSSTDDPIKSLLLPHAWLHMSILPEAGIRRRPIGTRSHIILGSRSLPLCMNQPGVDVAARDKSNSCVCNGTTRSGSGETSHQTRHNAAVLATIGSPLASRQPRTFYTQLNPIQEVDSKGESYYDLLCGPKLTPNTSSSSSASSSSDGGSSSHGGSPSSNTCCVNRLTAEISSNLSPLLAGSPQLPSIPTQQRSRLKRMQRVLCKDVKRRYLCPLRLPHHLNNWDVTEHVPIGPRTLDLELASYQQTLMHKCRESLRNLRYGVFSDTELLTGKFTITSRDDSAIDTGEDEVQSSRESLEAQASSTTRQQRHGTSGEEDHLLPNPEFNIANRPCETTSHDRVNGEHKTDRYEQQPSVGKESQESQTSQLIIESKPTAEVSLDCEPIPTASDVSRPSDPTRAKTESDPKPGPTVARPTPIEDQSHQNDDDNQVDEEDDEDSQNNAIRSTRQNVPPPVVIHRRRFTGLSEPAEHPDTNVKLHQEEGTESHCEQPHQSHRQQHKHYKESSHCSGTSETLLPISRTEITGSRGPVASETVIDALDSPAQTPTMATTSSTTDSTSGSDLNETSQQSQPVKGSTRPSWLTRRVPILVHQAHANGSRDGDRPTKPQTDHRFTATNNASTERTGRNLPDNAMGSSTKREKHSLENSSTSGSSSGTRNTPKITTTKVTRTVYTPAQSTHSITVTAGSNRPATSPRSRREPVTPVNKSETSLKTVNSRRAVATASPFTTILSKSSPNSPDYSLAGQRKLHTLTASPKKRGVTKSELATPNYHQNGAAQTSYTRCTTQVSYSNANPNLNRDVHESTRTNGHIYTDPSVPAPPPIPPRTSSRTQGYQTKTTVTRPSTHSATFRTLPQSEANSPLSATRPSPLEVHQQRFIDSPQFRSSSNSRTCSPSSSSSYGYSPQLYSPGMGQHAYQPTTCTTTVRLNNDSGRCSAVPTTLQSLYPRLPVPVVRRDSQGYPCPTRQPDHAMNYHVPHNGHLPLHLDGQLTNCPVSTRAAANSNNNDNSPGVNLSIPRVEHRAYRRQSKDSPELMSSIGNADSWDGRGYGRPSMTPHSPGSRWSQASREHSGTRAYSRERPI